MDLRRNVITTTYRNNPLDWKALVKFLVVFVGIILITFISMIFIKPDFENVLHELGKQMPHTKNGMNTFIALFFNNAFRVSLIAFILALIPIPYLYFLNFGATAASIGFVYYLLLVLPKVSFLQVMVLTLPHGILETIGLGIVCIALAKINRVICRRIYRRKKDVSIKKTIIASFKTYILYAVPILLIAALIEALITPLLG
ncbi:stage II sporulation protein M [Convivina praedatoris]|uniref:Stage II sporulation protein M n=1 Tax=Convivina praedatoris TaxID=2880963 RepID=A0ABM9D570_9LACO|nr:stage II sporulation protein M [Convivina sp. LMG 32447]CAH1855945.1 hypothetical protein R077815_01323 [Convivina sp. LMG 32447]CAH1856527.1 hypothetical protein LMG032447_01307 [Convivina sp. LMG 32447]CAH1857286.1 hypothetical protein R078138_01551 [Convivina sp. LMG 32447]